METIAGIKRFMDDNADGMIELQELLTSIPALAPENNGDGNSKKPMHLKIGL